MGEGPKRVLVTGATGQIGSELVPELRKRYGGQNVIAAGHRRRPSEEMLRSGPYIELDLTDRAAVMEAVKGHDIEVVYHLAAILSGIGEKDPMYAWNVNMSSLVNMLEACRTCRCEKMFWPSSIAVFGPSSPRLNTPQDAVLLPTSMYGVTKVSGELLCNYYHSKFGLDVRSVRFPGIISSETLPGGGTTDYAVEIFHHAIRNGRYKCFVRKDTVLPMLYMPDCIKCTLGIMEAPAEKVRRHDGYNVTGMSFSVEELVEEIRKHIPDLEVTYEPDHRQTIADSWPMSLDDSAARRDWGWSPDYDLSRMTRDMIERLTFGLRRKG
ncbi:MAG: NAD-dependent epimerase/dehydratase family protein [Methanomassiliicoccales archaeon]|nr:MAG: NAD-dependent epimerase/dehydratase family protein [Methanomassiliicoccales archaeon]